MEKLNQLFPLGQIVATSGFDREAREHFESQGYGEFVDEMVRKVVVHALARHVSGDAGMMPPEDWKVNEDALKYGDRIISKYLLVPADRPVYVITEADRSYTTILFCDEY